MHLRLRISPNCRQVRRDQLLVRPHLPLHIAAALSVLAQFTGLELHKLGAGGYPFVSDVRDTRPGHATSELTWDTGLTMSELSRTS